MEDVSLWIDAKDSLFKLINYYNTDQDKVIEAFDDRDGPEYVQHSDMVYALKWMMTHDKFPSREDYTDVANCKRERWCFCKPQIVIDEKGDAKYIYPERQMLPSAFCHGFTEDSSVKAAVLWLAWAIRELRKVVEIGPTNFPKLEAPPKQEVVKEAVDEQTNLKWSD